MPPKPRASTTTQTMCQLSVPRRPHHSSPSAAAARLDRHPRALRVPEWRPQRDRCRPRPWKDAHLPKARQSLPAWQALSRLSPTVPETPTVPAPAFEEVGRRKGGELLEKPQPSTAGGRGAPACRQHRQFLFNRKRNDCFALSHVAPGGSEAPTAHLPTAVVEPTTALSAALGLFFSSSCASPAGFGAHGRYPAMPVGE